MLESSLPATTIAPRNSHINKSWQNAAGMPSYKNAVVSWQGLTGGPYHHFEIGLYYRETADSALIKKAETTVLGTATSATLPAIVPQAVNPGDSGTPPRYVVQMKGYLDAAQPTADFIIIETIIKES